jgi:hypothetical protein
MIETEVVYWKAESSNMSWLKHIRKKTSPYPLLAVFMLVAADISCTPIQGDPAMEMIGRGEAYQTALFEAITTTGEADEVVISGDIGQIGLGCDAGEASCYLNLKRDTLTIQVFYNGSSTDINSCPNKEPASQVAELERGDRVEIYGKQTIPGTIYLCDSQDYFIRKITTADATPDP